MYQELGHFIKHIARQRSVWCDGDLWTALVGGAAVGCWVRAVPEVGTAISVHVEEIMAVSSILLGFVLTTLIFYIPVVSEWRKSPQVQNVADKIIDWHVWTVVCIIAQLFCTVIVCGIDGRIYFGLGLRPVGYGIFAFLTLYCAFQLLNHALTIWWTYRRQSRLVPTTPIVNDHDSSKGSGAKPSH